MTLRSGIDESTDRRDRIGICFGAALGAALVLPAAAGGPVQAQQAQQVQQAAPVDPSAAGPGPDPDAGTGGGGQTQTANPRLTLDVSTGLLFESDDRDDDVGLTTEVSLGYLSQTRGQRLAFDASGLLDLSDDNNSDDLRPRFRLSYGAQNRATALSFDASYARREVEGNIFNLVPIDAPPDLPVDDPSQEFFAQELIADDGTRVDASASVTLETGRDARFGTTTRLRASQTRFDDTEADDLDERDNRSIETTLRFIINPQLTARVTASRQRIDEKDETDLERDRTRFGLGATMALDPIWTLSADLTRAELDTTRGLTTRTTETEDGVELALSLTRDMPNGTLGFSLDRDITEDGERQSFQVSRALSLADGSALSLSLGAINFDGDETRPFGSLSYNRPTAQGVLGLSVSQSAAVNDDDESILRTRLNGSFRRALTPRDDLTLGLSYSAVDNVDDGDDTARAEVSLSHRRELGRDWGLTTRLSHRVDFEDGDRDDEESRLSLRLGRTFIFRP